MKLKEVVIIQFLLYQEIFRLMLPIRPELFDVQVAIEVEYSDLHKISKYGTCT